MRVDKKVLFTEDNVRRLSALLAPNYEKFNWEWAGVGIPKKEHIEAAFKDLANNAIRYRTRARTGGIYAEYKSEKLYIGIDTVKNHFGQLISDTGILLILTNRKNPRE